MLVFWTYGVVNIENCRTVVDLVWVGVVFDFILVFCVTGKKKKVLHVFLYILKNGCGLRNLDSHRMGGSGAHSVLPVAVVETSKDAAMLDYNGSGG